jgi:hypothetical protein
MTSPSVCTPSFLLPLVIATLILLDIASSASSVIDFSTIGPSPTNAGSGVFALTDFYNESRVPYNASRPTVAIALSSTATLVQALEFLVDITNFRGGVNIAGEQHNTAVTYTTDNGSDVLVRYAYEEMFASGSYAIYFAPDTDVLLQSIAPILPGSNATLMAPYNMNPADYQAHYPNIFSVDEAS